MTNCSLRLLWVNLLASSPSLLLTDYIVHRLNKKTQIHCPIIFLTPPSSGNTVTGGGQKEGGHALGDDK